MSAVFGVVYLIWNMVNGKKYVGQTVKPLKRRFKEHSKNDSAIGNAIKKYGKNNFRYGVIKSCSSKEELDYWEKFYIAALRSKCPTGYNRTDGGDGVVGWTDEMRAKVSAANTGKKRTAEQCANISAAQKGKKLSPQHCANLSAARKGKKRKPEVGANISKALTGKIRSPEHCANLSKAKKGKPLKDETRDHMSESRIGDKNPIYGTERPQETCIKISVKNRGETPFKNLLNEIDNRQLTYTDISKILGICSATVSEKMHGRRNFTENDKTKLAEFFNKPIDYLFKRDDDGGYVKSSSKNRGKSPYKNLKAELEARQLSYAKLAELMGAEKNSIGRKMRGKLSFMEREKEKLAEIFGKPIEYLLAREE